MNAGDVMTTRVISVLPDTSVREVARMLFVNRISALPVVDESGRVLGMLSEGDLVRRAKSGPDGGGAWWLAAAAGGSDSGAVAAGLRARDVMTREVIRVEESTPLAAVAALLERHRIKRVPVERNGVLVGIVSRANLIQGLAAEPAAGGDGDADARGAILARLAQASVATHLLNVVVTGGTAWLWGAVESESERQAVLAAAQTAPGVARVSDHLCVLAERLRGGLRGD